MARLARGRACAETSDPYRAGADRAGRGCTIARGAIASGRIAGPRSRPRAHSGRSRRDSDDEADSRDEDRREPEAEPEQRQGDGETRSPTSQIMSRCPIE